MSLAPKKILKKFFNIYVLNKVTLFVEKNVLKNPRKHFITKTNKVECFRAKLF